VQGNLLLGVLVLVRTAVKGKRATDQGLIKVLKRGLTAKTYVNSGLWLTVKGVKGKSSTAQKWGKIDGCNDP
jgi:hypothetical protein